MLLDDWLWQLAFKNVCFSFSLGANTKGIRFCWIPGPLPVEEAIQGLVAMATVATY